MGESALLHLRRLREPFGAMNEQIVGGLLRRYGPRETDGLTCVEIGAADGQLRDWLPDAMQGGLIQTEPSAPGIAQLRRRYPDADCRRCSAYELPFDDGAVDIIFGLCVYDGLDEPRRARDEFARVLRPGGLFIHLLDMRAKLAPLFAEMVAAGELPLPNCFADTPVAVRGDRSRLHAPPLSESLDDLIVTNYAEFAALIGAFAKAKHTLAERLAPYVKEFDPAHFDPHAASQFYNTLLADAAKLGAVNEAVRAIHKALNERAVPDVMPLSVTFTGTWKYLRAKLESHFDEDHGFHVELSRLVAYRRVLQHDPSLDPSVVFLARILGRTVTRQEVPSSLCGLVVYGEDEDRPDFDAWRSPGPGQMVLESGMYAFVARKR